MQINGITPVTTIDYPGYLSCVLFVQGCPLRCRFCHNGHLLSFDTPANYSENYVWDFLDERKNFCEAVVISGGEPYSQKDIKEFILKVKQMGYRIAVHTSGYYCEKFLDTLTNLDWVGLDIKCLIGDYKKLTGADCGGVIFASLQGLVKSGVPYEVRTTLDPYYFDSEKLLLLADFLSKNNVTNYVLQEYRDVVPNENHKHFSQIVSEENLTYIKTLFPNFTVRRAYE